MTAWWRDPGTRSTAILVLLAVVGFVSIGLAWRGLAGLGEVPLQVPWVVSGGLLGIALTGTGLALLDVHLERRRAAYDRISVSVLIDEMAQLVDEAIEQRSRQPGGLPREIVDEA